MHTTVSRIGGLIGFTYNRRRHCMHVHSLWPVDTAIRETLRSMISQLFYMAICVSLMTSLRFTSLPPIFFLSFISLNLSSVKAPAYSWPYRPYHRPRCHSQQVLLVLWWIKVCIPLEGFVVKPICNRRKLAQSGSISKKKKKKERHQTPDARTSDPLYRL